MRLAKLTRNICCSGKNPLCSTAVQKRFLASGKCKKTPKCDPKPPCNAYQVCPPPFCAKPPSTCTPDCDADGDGSGLKFSRNLSLFVMMPTLILTAIFVFMRVEEEQLKPRQEFVPYSYLYIRNKVMQGVKN